MLVLIRICIASQSILNLQEVGLVHVDAPCSQSLCILFFICLTYNEVNVVQTDGSIVSQRVLNQRIGIFAMSLGKALILLCKIYTVTLNPCWNPSLVIATCCAIREIDLICKVVVLRLDSNHIKQIHIS